MPNRIIFEVGTDIIELPIKGTVVQIRTAIKRFVAYHGNDLQGKTAKEVGELALQQMLRDVRDVSITVQREELLTAQREALEATLATENNF